MKENQNRYRLEFKNEHLLDILSSNYYLELGVIDIYLMDDILKGKQLNLLDLVYSELAEEGTGHIGTDENDIYYQVNYLVSLRQKSSTDKFFITCNAIRYINDEGIETYSPIVLIPVEIDYNNFKIVKAGDPVPNTLLLSYLQKKFFIHKHNPIFGRTQNKKNAQAELEQHLEEFKTGRLNSLEAIDKYSFDLANKCGLKYIIYNYLTTVKVDYHDYSSDADFFDMNRSIYSKKPEEIHKEFFQKAKAILPTNIYQKHAILKAINGEKFVINGKLGSGKSYTALNIIADQLSKNKRILYVNQDIDNLYEMEKNLRLLKLDNCIYNFSKNFKHIDLPEATFLEKNNNEFDFSTIDRLETYYNEYDYKIHGFSKRRIYENLAILKRKYGNIEKVRIQENLEYFESEKTYEVLKQVEAKLKKIDPYPTNCWRNITVEHNNISSEEISKRTKKMLQVNDKLLTGVEHFCDTFFLKQPANIADLYIMMTNLDDFNKTRPLLSWLDYKTRVDVKYAVTELKNLSDIYYSAVEFYNQNILNTYKYKHINSIIKRLNYTLFNMGDIADENDEIYINKLLNEKNKVIQLIENIKTISNEFNILEKRIKELFDINQIEEYTYSIIEELYLLLSNNIVLKKWYSLFDQSYNEFVNLHDKTIQINNDLESYRKQLTQYLLKPEYLGFQYTDEAAKSGIFIKYAKKYFNKKVLQSAHVSIDLMVNVYEQYYKKQLELNHSIVDMTQVKRVSIEEQHQSFSAFANYARRLSKLETKIIKNFFNNSVFQDNADVQKAKDDLHEFLLKINSLRELENRLREFKIELKGNLPLEKAANLKEWQDYFEDVIQIGKELEGIFKYNSDIHYTSIVHLAEKDSQIIKVTKDIEKKKDYFVGLLGDSYNGFDTDITAISKLLEYFDQFSERFIDIKHVKQLFDENIFPIMVKESDRLMDIYNEWFICFKAFSGCFRGGQAILQRQSLIDNRNALKNFISKLHQLDDVIFISSSIKDCEKIKLHDVALGIKLGEIKDNVADRFYYSILEKHRVLLEEKYINDYKTKDFLNDLEEYNKFELDYCTNNIHNLRKSVEHDKRPAKVNNMKFNDYNYLLKVTERQRGIFLSDLNIFNSNIDLSSFDIVLIDDAHLSTANKYSRIQECKQAIVFGDKGFRSSIVNTLMQRTPESASIDYPYRYIVMSNKYNNTYSTNNQYILSSKTKTFIQKNASIDEFVDKVIEVFYENTDQVINIVVGKLESKRTIYSKLISKLENFYSQQDITIIFSHKIRLIDSNFESGMYVDNVFFYYDDYLDADDSAIELLFKNFSVVRKRIFINYLDTNDEGKNEEIKNKIDSFVSLGKERTTTTGICAELINDLKKRYLRTSPGVGLFDFIVRGNKNIGIIISGKKESNIYSNIDSYNYYITTYKKFGWEVLLIDIVDLVDNYQEVLSKIIDLSKK